MHDLGCYFKGIRKICSFKIFLSHEWLFHMFMIIHKQDVIQFSLLPKTSHHVEIY